MNKIYLSLLILYSQINAPNFHIHQTTSLVKSEEDEENITRRHKRQRSIEETPQEKQATYLMVEDFLYKENQRKQEIIAKRYSEYPEKEALALINLRKHYENDRKNSANYYDQPIKEDF